MSNATGEVRVGGEVIGYFEYHGSVDIAHSAIRTRDEISAGWRTSANDRECKCSPSVEVMATMIADYGGGVEWEGRICATCLTIIDCDPDTEPEPAAVPSLPMGRP